MSSAKGKRSSIGQRDFVRRAARQHPGRGLSQPSYASVLDNAEFVNLPVLEHDNTLDRRRWLTGRRSLARLGPVRYDLPWPSRDRRRRRCLLSGRWKRNLPSDVVEAIPTSPWP
jgi:hypothetical protein